MHMTDLDNPLAMRMTKLLAMRMTDLDELLALALLFFTHFRSRSVAFD